MRKYIEKHRRIKEKNLKYDFLPSMLEIIEKPENRISEFLIFTITGMLIVTVLWAAYFKVDIVVTAYGSVNSQGNIITVNNEYAGVVTEIYVEEGEYVEEGDFLLMLDNKAENDALMQLAEDIEILEIQQEMYQRIYNEEDISEFDTSVYEEHAGVAEAICVEQEAYLLQVRQYDIARQTSEEKKLLDAQKETFCAERELTVVQNLNTIEERIRAKEAEMEQLRIAIDGKMICASVSGIISNLQINQAGYYLPVGQNITYIIPDEAEVIFCAYVQTADIESIEVGDVVNVKLSSLADTEYELIQGEIQSIGTLPVSVNGLGSVYPVDVVLRDVPQDMLHIGLEGTCDIIGGQRSVLDYFLEPFRKGLEESLREG
ncbi:MAG: HlyD family efflux transporter periplasmic adaptor subunit [Alphaproteobacteria bacterium]|nr:HlyD family efflux transporter periplasmic adaptor subunit [Alphaproteobacteria bacterium]